MKFRRRARADASIDLTALIDVVFLLLIFFMVSTTFIRESSSKSRCLRQPVRFRSVRMSKSKSRSGPMANTP
jgi:hypothetical protein